MFRNVISLAAAAFILMSAQTGLANGADTPFDLPALFDVRDVASDDVLNVRASPSASGALIGQLAYNAMDIEVVETQGNWGRVNLDEASGWVSMRYLAMQLDSAMPEAVFARCFGTEPFWALDMRQGGAATMMTPMGEDKSFHMGNFFASVSRPEPFATLGSATTGSDEITVVMNSEICSDGMSDRLYGLSGTVVMRGDLITVLDGCCSVANP